jgi:type IV pilus assembly protein PilW
MKPFAAPLARQPRRPRARQAGVGLVETLVAMVIGMIAVIVMMRTFAVAEEAKRNTTGGNDAQSAATITQYGIQRDLQQAGHGFALPMLLDCSLTLPSGAVISGFAPVRINHASIPAGDANTDTLLVSYGRGTTIPAGDRVRARAGTTSYRVTAPSAFSNGDYVIFAAANNNESHATNCASLRMDVVNDGDLTDANVVVTTGTAGSDTGALFNLGPAPRVVAYAVRNGTLTVCDLIASDCTDTTKTGDSTIWVPIASNVVAMRVQYGRDTTATMDATVDSWDQTEPAAGASNRHCLWLRHVATRVALVVRSTQYDKEEVTSSAPTLDWGAGSGSTVTLTNPMGETDEWKHYRYRTTQVRVPLRNMAWAAQAEVEEALCI